MQQVQLNVDDEVKSVADALKVLIADIQAKKPIAQIAADVLPALLSAMGSYQSVGADIKKVDNQVYLVKCLAEALEPAPAPVA